MASGMNVAVICAANPSNSGMYSVDLAARQFFQSRGIPFQLFVTQIKGRQVKRMGELEFHLLKSLQKARGFSHIVYWGDFLNNPEYGRTDFAARDIMFQTSPDLEAAKARWLELFAPDKDERPLLSIGNNFQHDALDPDPLFAEATDRIQRNFRIILPRDALSVSNLSRSFRAANLHKIQPGMDCAFLLKGEPAEERGPFFSYYFGRSGFKDQKRLVRRLEEVTGLQGREVSRWLRLEKEGLHGHFQDRRQQLACSQFVVTDVYHLSVNTLNMRTPVLCLGRPSQAQQGTLGDMKKRFLFQMLGLGEFYVESQRANYVDIHAFLERIADPRDFDERLAIKDALTLRFQRDIETALAA
ncbi:hypothetical protein [Paracoccus tibetensis]|uniref:Polysaccharide pyruvyl transferase n=1 Tax=Paracoccus tibetensis TaxID=336292 RepID=A0A1G5JRF8_9RHOB|nr:hypothetical protein [Paracoccus tibetensis]SCY90983.1 hypothetical protein SAMN05660710_03397 [Paracoccus tibetensis]